MKAKLQTNAPVITKEQVAKMVETTTERIVADVARKSLDDKFQRDVAQAMANVKNIVESAVREAIRPAVKACLQDELASGDYEFDVSPEIILEDCKPLEKRIAALEAKLAAIEQQKPQTPPQRFDAAAETSTTTPAKKVEKKGGKK